MMVLIVIPVFNEEVLLANTVLSLCEFVRSRCDFDYEILIADNGSTDKTLQIANSLACRYSCVRVFHLDLKGRGRALKKAWTESTADILSYMDADLSTTLEALPPLIGSLGSGKFDLATGSRLLSPQLTTRSFKREMISRSCNLLVKMGFGTHFSDAQCGFKAITQAAARELLPLVEDTGWFFDTELLIFAEKLGYRIFDMPVCWVENQQRKSSVKITGDVVKHMVGLCRLRRKCADLERFDRKNQNCPPIARMR